MNVYAIPGIISKENKARIIEFKNYPEITSRVCKITGQNETQVIKRTRKREIVFTRQVCMSLAKLKLNNVSLQAVGAYYGGFDHATVIHAMKTTKNLIDTNRGIREEIGHLFEGVKWPIYK